MTYQIIFIAVISEQDRGTRTETENTGMRSNRTEPMPVLMKRINDVVSWYSSSITFG